MEGPARRVVVGGIAVAGLAPIYVLPASGIRAAPPARSMARSVVTGDRNLNRKEQAMKAAPH